MLAVDREAVALTIRRIRAADVRALIPVDPKPFQVFQQLMFIARLAALEVSVLDAQNHGAACLAGKQPVIESGAGVADVQLPGGRRRKTYTYLGILAHTLMLARAAGVGHSLLTAISIDFSSTMSLRRARWDHKDGTSRLPGPS